MLTISKPLSSGQANNYHRLEFVSADQNYWNKGPSIWSEWRGHLALQWGLNGNVGEREFALLSEGRSPTTEEQLIRHQARREYVNSDGEWVSALEHRAGWDATLSAPKSVSLTALVGGDERVREAHRESVRCALAELERLTHARVGSLAPSEVSGKFVAATFEHDTSRPVQDYAAPQLHTHAVIFNLTEHHGTFRALQPREFFRSQKFITAVYRSELAFRLANLGYEIEIGEYGQPEIRGYSQDYLNASSPRRQQILEYLETQAVSGPKAAEIAALCTREGKRELTAQQVVERHLQLANEYGNQAQEVVESSYGRAHGHNLLEAGDARTESARTAVDYALMHDFERSAVQDKRRLFTSALMRSFGTARLQDISNAFQEQVESGRVRILEDRAGLWTTQEMIELEQKNVQFMISGKGKFADLVPRRIADQVLDQDSRLSESQAKAAEMIFSSRDRIIGLEGFAGSGKTTTLACIRKAVECAGYKTEGFAPTSRAAQKLEEAGLNTSTLQRYLERGPKPETGEKRLYIIDESSLASTRQMQAFFASLHEPDRVLLVGDTRQHEAIEAGRPFAQLKEAGMQTARLYELVRQQDPELKAVVENLAHGQVHAALQQMESQGRIFEILSREQRFEVICRDYLTAPDETLIISPDNQSRIEINRTVRQEMQARGMLDKEEFSIRTLISRQEMTGAERLWAERYAVENVIHFSRTSSESGIERGEYATVTAIDPDKNLLTVMRANGVSTTYDPRRHAGVAVFRAEDRLFAAGERIQFTNPRHDLRVSNRELGTIESINSQSMQVRFENGRRIRLDPRQQCHLDHGYAVTSHSSQGQTTERVLIHADTEHTHPDLLNSRMAYVAVSRAKREAKIFTNSRDEMIEALCHDISQKSAFHVTPVEARLAQQVLEIESHRRSFGFRI